MKRFGHILQKHGKYYVYLKGKYLGLYFTREEAERELESRKKIYEPVNCDLYLPLFAERLNEAIGKDGRAVTDICRQAGIDRTNIARYLNGNYPNLPNLISLSLALRVSTDWLLGLRE